MKLNLEIINQIIPNNNIFKKKKQSLILKVLRKKTLTKILNKLMSYIWVINSNILRNVNLLIKANYLLLTVSNKKYNYLSNIYKNNNDSLTIKTTYLKNKLSLLLKEIIFNFNKMDILLNSSNQSKISKLSLTNSFICENVIEIESLYFNNFYTNKWNLSDICNFYIMDLYFYICSILSLYKTLFILLYSNINILNTLNTLDRSFLQIPTNRSRYTVIRSPHIDKKSREQFEKSVYIKLLRLPYYTHSYLSDYLFLKDVFWLDSLFLYKCLINKKC